MVEEETPVVADSLLFGVPVCFVPVRRGSDWCALAVFHALFPGVSVGGPGNLSLGLPHVPSKLRGVGFSQFSALVTNITPWVSFTSSRPCTAGRSYFRVRLRVTFRVSGNRVITSFVVFGTRSELLCPWSSPTLIPISS